MSYPWVTPLVAALASLVLVWLGARHRPRTHVTDVFTFLAAVLVFWNLNFFVLYWIQDRALALELTRFFRIGACLAPPAVFHLALALRGNYSRVAQVALLLNYAIACGFVGANAFGIFVYDVRPFVFGFYSVGTPIYDMFGVYVLVNFVAAFGLFLLQYRSCSDPRRRLQLKFWLFGALVALPLGLTNLLPTYGVAFYPLGNLGSVVWAGIVGYAILRHRLMDIDLVVTKGAAYASVSLVLIAPAFGFMLWVQHRSFGQIHHDFSIAMLVILIAVGMLYPTLRLRAESRIARSLFGDKHAYRLALRNFTRSIVRILDRERLVSELASTLADTLGLDRLAILMLDQTTGRYHVTLSRGAEPVVGEMAKDSPFVSFLRNRRETMLRSELEAVATQSGAAAGAELLRRNEWEVCIPLVARGELIGLIGLGRKRNLDAFFSEDLELLGTLAAEASVALENARLNEELRRSEDIIRRADRLSALGTLAAGIAHEIRNPLVSIQTFFQLAPQRLDDQEFLTEFLNLTSGEVRRITDLISELLSFARSPNPVTTDVDLNALVDSAARLVAPQLKSGQIEIVRHLSPDLPPTRADRDQLKQVFLNILLNAVQAMDGGGEVRLTSRTTQLQGEVYCVLEISDTGRGMPPEIIEEIFNPFFTTKDKGTGLGLAISNQVVAEHGGFISVESQVDKGTTFRIHLPSTLHVGASPYGEDTLTSTPEPRVAGMRPRHR